MQALTKLKNKDMPQRGSHSKNPIAGMGLHGLEIVQKLFKYTYSSSLSPVLVQKGSDPAPVAQPQGRNLQQ